MKKLFYVVLVFALGYAGWHFLLRPKQAAPLVDRSYVALYGTSTCGVCAQYREELGKMGIPFMDYDISNPSVQDQLYPRMRKVGLSTESFALPIIDVNGRIFSRPELDAIARMYRAPCGAGPAAKFANLCQIKTKPSGMKIPKINFLPQDPLEVSGISMDRKPFAIVGGTVVGIGDKVGQAEVLEIKPDGVTFRDGQGKVFTKKLK
ncbi:MAG TPA: hypothetical protein VMD52_00495 [Patescibacteria group bacterium]|nr:hypothetical protein [Patescibacteria group bacterium]